MKQFKNNLIVGLLGLSCLVFGSQTGFAQNQPSQTPMAAPTGPPKFSYSPSTLSEGQEMKIVYRPDDATAKIAGVVYLFKNYKWEGHDLPLTKTDTGYIANYKVPEGTALLTCRFWVGDTIDVAGRFPYSVILHQKDPKKMMPGSLAEWGLFRTKQANYMMLPFVSPSSEIEPRTLVALWIAKEYGDMNVRRNMFFDMARGIKSYVPPAKADSIILQGGKDILNMTDVSEREMVKVERTFRTVLRNATLADSVKAVILAKYSNSLRRRLLDVDSIYFTAKPELKVAKLNAFLQKYPYDKFPTEDYLDATIADPMFYMSGYNGAIIGSYVKQNYAMVKSLLKTAPYRMLNYYYLQFVDYPMRSTTPGITVKQQLEFSKDVIAEIERRAASTDPSISGRGYFSAAEWPRIVTIENKTQLTYHARLLYEAGDYAGALKYADLVKPYVGYQDIVFNTLYANLLNHNKQYAAAEQYIIKAIQTDAVGPETLALFRTYYVKKKGSEAGYDQYYHSLEPAEKLTAMYAKLEKSMISKDAPNFVLKNLQGESVDLKAQKGKIVVLDFWASWCFPCKAAMPGMQTLVEKYKSDSNVQFYFIATLEESEQYKKLAADFIKAKKYDFNVLFDEFDPSIKRLGMVFGDYAKLLHLNGIPQKVIIDGNGKVRWVSDGFSGDLVNLTREVEHIIAVIQQEKS